MIVKIKFKANPDYERLVECDTVHVRKHERKLVLILYKDKKCIESPVFKESADIFMIENGKTVDTIHFTIE